MAAPGARVQMVCTALPPAAGVILPPGYAIRPYQPGDESAWVAVHRLADPCQPSSLALFEQQFGGARNELPRRQLYLVDAAATVIGTASAWFGSPAGAGTWGRVHWVAIVPAEQGRGLAKPLLHAVLRRLLELGHHQAYLTTSTARLPALNLYFACGFLPDLAPPGAVPAWATLIDPGAGLPADALRPGLRAWLAARLAPANGPDTP